MSTTPFKDTMTDQYVHWFRNSAPYINTHRGKTFVLLFGGEAVNHEHPLAVVHARDEASAEAAAVAFNKAAKVDQTAPKVEPVIAERITS